MLPLIVTTNHPENLDSALIRPGRIDRKAELTWATASQTEAFFLRFFPGETTLASEFSNEVIRGREYSMAQIQEILIGSDSCPQKAIELLHKRQGE